MLLVQVKSIYLFALVFTLVSYAPTVLAQELEQPEVSPKQFAAGLRISGAWGQDSDFVPLAEVHFNYLLHPHWQLSGAYLKASSDVKVIESLGPLEISILNFSLKYQISPVSTLTETFYGPILDYQSYKIGSRTVPLLGFGGFINWQLDSSAESLTAFLPVPTWVYAEALYSPLGLDSQFDVNSSLIIQALVRFLIHEHVLFETGLVYKAIDFHDKQTVQDLQFDIFNFTLGFIGQF